MQDGTGKNNMVWISVSGVKPVPKDTQSESEDSGVSNDDITISSENDDGERKTEIEFNTEFIPGVGEDEKESDDGERDLPLKILQNVDDVCPLESTVPHDATVYLRSQPEKSVDLQEMLKHEAEVISSVQTKPGDSLVNELLNVPLQKSEHTKGEPDWQDYVDKNKRWLWVVLEESEIEGQRVCEFKTNHLPTTIGHEVKMTGWIISGVTPRKNETKHLDAGGSTI
ncbi:hypothetical protein LOTGIDRAFT_170201 [Lottia gigantea]|uniref:Uncharacterized protein n=1 Tax=Lottia gigantea TaxID=225164 RepID=V3ZN66_LOTGI|nr:hypothetical protein LOTGIDRAFT_170201 [Lottia gigantea]ESO82281.1 hypothetical protein LOTGIDRAFT_170201 [Lottia gigantea]